MTEFIPISRMLFMPFGDRLDRFFGFFLLLFLHFSVVCRQKKLCCSFIRIIRFRDFFASSGYFLSSAEKFFHPIPVFSVLFLNSFRRKSLFFSASASRFRAFFPYLSNHFRAFSRAVWRIFLSVSIIFPLFSELSGGKIHISQNVCSVRLLSPERNFSTILVFFGSRSVFLPVLCRRPPCFFPVIPIFHPESFAFCGCHLPFFISHSGIFRFPEHFFLPVLCRRPPCFFSVIPIFLRNLLRFMDAVCRVFISHSGIFWFPKHFFVSLVQALAVFFLRHPDFSPESFAFYGCCLLFFYQPFRYFSVPGAFFSVGLV